MAALVASTLSLQPATALAQEHRKRDRHEDRRDDNDRRHDDRSVPYDRRNDDDRRIDVRRGYDAARYYRSGRGYQPYRLGRNDRIYRGYDNRYYCPRDDGTTGLIVGAMAGGVLGHVIGARRLQDPRDHPRRRWWRAHRAGDRRRGGVPLTARTVLAFLRRRGLSHFSPGDHISQGRLM